MIGCLRNMVMKNKSGLQRKGVCDVPASGGWELGRKPYYTMIFFIFHFFNPPADGEK